MSSSICRSSSSFRQLTPRARRLVLIALPLIVVSIGPGCTATRTGANANSAASQGAKPNAVGNANVETRAVGSQPTTIDIKEPERYTVAMTISAQVSDDPSKMPTLQFTISRLDADKRWSFTLPSPLGQVVYLEKSGLKYLILFDRKQYVELTTDDLGFQLARVLTPSAVANQLKPPARFDDLGVEPVNGRTARKYRFSGAGGSLQAGGIIYVDQETGLPVRSEFDQSTSAGKNLRVIVEVRDIQLNPDRSLFDVPAGMKKLSTQDAKQQILSFASTLRSFAEMTSGAQPSPGATQPTGNRNATGLRR